MSRIDLHAEELRAYPVRMAWAVVASLLLAIAAFRWWPAPATDSGPVVFDTRARDVISVEEIQPTRQQQNRPPPPAPVPPVVVPDDVDLPDVELELTDAMPVDLPVENARPGIPAPPSSGRVQPDAGPRPVRIVEPEYTEEARRRKIRAEVLVEVLVNVRGRVAEARITERWIVKGDEESDRERVAALGYGLEEAVVSAAREWMFRPARQEGRPVESWTTLTFTFGL